MKALKLSSILLFLLITFGFTACKDKEPEFEIYENHGISACGIEDPLVNFDWLAEYTAKDNPQTPYFSSYSFNISIQLYLNNETQENYIVIIFDLIKPLPDGYEPMDEYSLKEIYSCTGERLFVDSTGRIDQEAWNDFFYSGKNTSQGVIWSRKALL